MWYKVPSQSAGLAALDLTSVELIAYQPVENLKTERFSEYYVYKKQRWLLKQFSKLLNFLCFHKTRLVWYPTWPYSCTLPPRTTRPSQTISSLSTHHEYFPIIPAFRRVIQYVFNKYLLTLVENCLIYWGHRRQFILSAGITEHEDFGTVGVDDIINWLEFNLISAIWNVRPLKPQRNQ